VSLGLALLFVLTFQASAAYAAPGDFDRSFGSNGIVELETLDPTLKEAFQIAAGPNGTVYVLSSRSTQCGLLPPCERQLTVSRFRSDGALDANYGNGGTALAFPQLGGISDAELSGRSDIAVDSLGRAVVVAQQEPDVLISRLDVGGDPDVAFGGVRRLSPGATPTPKVLSTAVLDDDRIVVLASWSDEQQVRPSEPSTRVLVARLLTDGALDPAFGSSGVVNALVQGSSFFDSFAAGRDGSVIAVGEQCCGSAPWEPILLRIPEDGASYDPEFGARIWGESLTDRLGHSRPEPFLITVNRLFMRRNDRIDILVTSQAGKRGEVSFLLRVRPNLRLDENFGNGGVRKLPKPVKAAAIDSEGRIFIISQIEDTSLGTGAYLFRLSANGRPDLTFGGGKVFLFTRYNHFPGAQAAAFSGQRPVIFDKRVIECRYECDPHPRLIRLRGGGSNTSCLGRPATIVGTRRGEVLRGTRRADVIAALGGNDTVRAGRGDDLVCGGQGQDHLLGGTGRNRLRD
jgi:uncharacterized delta-60 repeat protein